jgi:hypothetical protein
MKKTLPRITRGETLLSTSYLYGATAISNIFLSSLACYKPSELPVKIKLREFAARLERRKTLLYYKRLATGNRFIEITGSLLS